MGGGVVDQRLEVGGGGADYRHELGGLLISSLKLGEGVLTTDKK